MVGVISVVWSFETGLLLTNLPSSQTYGAAWFRGIHILPSYAPENEHD